MKWLILSLTLIASIARVDAANPVKHTGGDLSVFAQAATTMVEIDDYKTVIEGRNKTADVYYGEKGKDKYDAFVSDLDRAHKSFVTYFNEKKPSSVQMTMADSVATADYTLKVNVAKMNVGNAAGAFEGVGRKTGGAVISGTMQLIDNSTGETLCEFEFDKVKGLLSPNFRARAISVYRYLADGLLKQVQ